MAYIYIIQAGKKGPYKIGLANNPHLRMQELQVGNHEKLRLIACVDFKTRKRAEAVERQLHKMFSRKRIRGEWFRNNIQLKRADAFFNLDCQKVVSFDEQKQMYIEASQREYAELEIVKEARNWI